MTKLILLPILAISLSVFADDDEMKTETKIDAKSATAPAVPTAEAKKSSPAQLDPKLRARIRAKAPFWIEDSSHGAAIRLNKDGTFTSEAQGGGSIAGSWKALKGGVLEISWSDGSEKYTYAVAVKGGGIIIQGKSAQKNRFKLN